MRTTGRGRWRHLIAFVAAAVLSGCTSYGVVKNVPVGTEPAAYSYSTRSWNERERRDDLRIVLAFSGGGTRAAALSYGVLKALRDTNVWIGGRNVRLLDEVDAITSVSGGSFTAAYYGLHGERIFTDFEPAFLRRDVDESLLLGVMNPLNWFRSSGRTERAIELYDELLFHGATYRDVARQGGPLVVINASDLGHGVRFSFLQEYFDLICSDLAAFPVARAVAASSAVPVLFNPVVVENYAGCGSGEPAWIAALGRRAGSDERLRLEFDGLASYSRKEQRRYAHLVDGGITDNLGLLAIFDLVEAAGGVAQWMVGLDRTPPRHLLLVVVNASTDPEPAMDASDRQPSLFETINAMSDVQLHRYNIATLELMRRSLAHWAELVSTPDRPVSAHFVQLSFRDAAPERRSFYNRIPTNFALTDKQVDALIAAGGELLHGNPAFRRFVAGLRD